MLEMNGNAFLKAATGLARLHQLFAGLTEAYEQVLAPQNAVLILSITKEFRSEVEKVGARLSVMSADRFITKLEVEPCPLTVAQAVGSLNDIESRFGDYLTDVKMFTLLPHEAIFLEDADSLISMVGFSLAFPRTSFEVEEASKSMALGRFTAAVFHAMRILEIGISALAKRLDIPDPAKPAEKNWGVILGVIQKRIDELWPKKDRLGGSEGAAFEVMYAHLEAVRNPWRNATMHVETIYAPHEAIHILRCAAFFMSKLSELCNEQGNPPAAPDFPELDDLDQPKG